MPVFSTRKFLQKWQELVVGCDWYEVQEKFWVAWNALYLNQCDIIVEYIIYL